MPRELPITPETRILLTRWLQTWNTPDLATHAKIELSPRLTRSLGRCYPDRRLIRIAAYVAQPKNGESLLHEVLCHELAHLAARELHGARIRLRLRATAGQVRRHGPEWKRFMGAAGYNPSTQCPPPPGAPGPAPCSSRLL